MYLKFSERFILRYAHPVCRNWLAASAHSWGPQAWRAQYASPAKGRGRFPAPQPAQRWGCLTNQRARAGHALTEFILVNSAVEARLPRVPLFACWRRKGGKSGGKAGGEKASSQSRSAKAGLQFPVGRIHRLLRRGHYAERIGAGAPGRF
ncbi:hypothetical protein O181_103895 [Austropuccinia psidii MF-1]|uniref:Histone H2A n=1 Tax=Austropuccinia psidii MF-1 TaxID=1389203 RepID=A0A9Q3JIW1_9BASI|nr:hypothetical protein [Austropuccinia psidii MF-1]